MGSICREQLQRLQHPKFPFLGYFRGHFWVRAQPPMAMGTGLPAHVFRGHNVPSPGMRESCGGKALLGPLHCLLFPSLLGQLIPQGEESREFVILGLLLMPHQSLESPAGPGGDSLHNLRQKRSPRMRHQPSAASPISQSTLGAPSPVQIPGKILDTHNFPAIHIPRHRPCSL